MKLNNILILSGFLGLTMAGCMVGPELEAPKVETEESFRFDSIAGDSMINLAWWELFGDPYLDSLIMEALEYNQDIQVAMSRVEQAYLALGVSKADLYPQVGYELSLNHGQPHPAGTGTGPGSLVTLTPNVYWELDFWGKVRRSNQAARAEIAASEEGLRLVQLGIITAVADGYFQLLDYDQRLYIARETWNTRLSSMGIIEHRFNRGIVPEIDLNQAQQQEAIAASAIPSFERMVAHMENYLGLLTGRSAGDIRRASLVEQKPPPPVPVGLPSELLERRPDLVQAEQLFYAETARIGVMQAMRFPNFSLTGALGAASSDLSSLMSSASLIYNIGGSVLGPVFNWGKNKRRKEIQEETARQALYRYELAVRTAMMEVDDALVDVCSYRRETESRLRQRDAAENAARLSRARYDGGQTAYLEVLESERSLFNAQLDASAAWGRQLSAYVYLYKALGGGWILPPEEGQE